MANLSIYIIVGLFGLIFGSFSNVLILRQGDWKGIFFGRSECVHCHKKLSWYELIPVLSFLFLRARCLGCKKPISWQYPLVELISGGLALLSYWYGGGNWGLAIGVFFSLMCFLIIAVEDIKSMEVALPYCVIGGLLGGLSQGLTHAISWINLGEGLLVGAGVILIISLTWKLFTKTDGMGEGDAWISGAIGLVAGWPTIIVALMAAVLSGAVIGSFISIAEKSSLKSRLPFGPFLFIGLLITLVWGKQVIAWYTKSI